MKYSLSILFLLFTLIVSSQNDSINHKSNTPAISHKKDSIITPKIDTIAYYRKVDATSNNFKIKYSDLKKIQDPTIKDYEGNYHFGKDETASTLEFLYSNETLFARNGSMAYTEENESDNTAKWTLKRENVTFSDGKIAISSEAGILYELHLYTGGGHDIIKEDTKGIVYSFKQKKFEEEKEDICIVFNDNNEFIRPEGQYPETSFVELVKNDLDKYSKIELGIMRNEIFARNGHIFMEGGKMESHFTKKEWYAPKGKLIEENLTPIEQKNVLLIKSLE